MEKKLYSVAYGPIKDGKPAKVDLVLAESFAHVIECAPCEPVSIQVLPDKPVIL